MILSICIPTYNRAELLRSALLSLAPQVVEFPGDVELIVSDNNSTPATRDVVNWAGQFCTIRYNQNPENVGAAKNLIICSQLAKGEYVWMPGDDDFIRPGAVKKVLDIIKQHPEVWYIYLNYASLSVQQLKAYPSLVAAKDLPNNLPTINGNTTCFLVKNWESLIRPEISNVYLGGVPQAVVRRSVWVEHAPSLNIGEIYSSMESTYPQIILFANGLIGKPAYYLGTPYIVVIDGAREWLENVPKICLVYLHEVLDYYESKGVDHEQIERCRKHLVKNNCYFIMEMLKGKEMKGIGRIFMMNYIAKYWKYMGKAFVRKVLK